MVVFFTLFALFLIIFHSLDRYIQKHKKIIKIENKEDSGAKIYQFPSKG